MATSRTSKRTPKILVVDDDPGLLRLLTIRLRAQKYEVEPAENAAKALSVIARFRPDLVITDIAMPQMDGYALARKMREQRSSMKIVALTAFPAGSARATDGIFDAYLTKPVEPTALVEAIADVVGR